MWRDITLDTGNVTPGPGSRGCHNEYCRHVTPSAGSERWGHPGDCESGTPGTRCWRWGHTVDCRHVTPDTESARWGHSGDCGCVTKSEGFGEAALAGDSDM